MYVMYNFRFENQILIFSSVTNFFLFQLSLLKYKILHTSLQTNIDPKTTWSPSKKFSPMIITVDPPDVQPSFGDIAFMHGVWRGTGV